MQHVEGLGLDFGCTMTNITLDMSEIGGQYGWNQGI